MKKLAKDKMLRALSNVTYTKDDYETKMEQAALKKRINDENMNLRGSGNLFEDIFKRKKLISQRLPAYGFVEENGHFYFTKDILNAEFALTVHIMGNAVVDTELVEKETGEPYILYKTNASGAFVGEIRTAIEQVLEDIAKHCYETAIFKSEQAQMVIDYVRDIYGDELEFLWTKFPDNAVWRRKDNAKWYGAILTVVGNKIGLDTSNIVEIIDLRMDKAQAEELLAREHYYPGWHMNKKSWYTIVLDGSVSNQELLKRIQESYELAQR